MTTESERSAEPGTLLPVRERGKLTPARRWQLLGSIAVTALFTWWAFRDTAWSAQWESLRSADHRWIWPYLGILLAIHLCRTLRWGALLSGLEKVPFKPLHEASAIGFMLMLVLPFRLGEFARPMLIASRTSIRRTAAMTTVVLERIVDGLLVATILRVMLWVVPIESPHLPLIKAAANLMFLGFGGGMVFLLFAYWQQARAVAIIQATLGRLSAGLAERATDIIDGFVSALRCLPGARQTLLFFGLTGVYWALNGLGMALLARAFDCTGASGACVPLTLGIPEAFIVMCVVIVGIMIPAAPGMMGTFQWAVKLGLGLFLPATVVNASGLAYANVLWLSQTLQQVVLGAIMLWVSSVSFRDLTGKLAVTPPTE